MAAARSLSIVEHIASGDSWLKQASWPGNSPAEATRKSGIAQAHYAAAAAKAAIDAKAPGELNRVIELADKVNEERAEAVRNRQQNLTYGKPEGLFQAPGN
jgi:hypothetical protein